MGIILYDFPKVKPTGLGRREREDIPRSEHARHAPSRALCSTLAASVAKTKRVREAVAWAFNFEGPMNRCKYGRCQSRVHRLPKIPR